MSLTRIQSVEPLSEFKVRLALSDGSVVDRDLASLVLGRGFETLRADSSLFRAVRVVDGTLEWPGGLDLDPDMIIYGGPPPLDAAAKPHEQTG